jgi:hypothetical protein
MFTVATMILQTPAREGWLNIIDVEGQMHRFVPTEVMRNGISSVPWWFRVWCDLPPTCNCAAEDFRIPENLLSGVGLYYPQHVVESENAYKRRMYDTLRVIEGKKYVSRLLRIMNTFPSINWRLMLGNLSQAVVSDAVCSVWYVVVHELVLTNVKLHSIHVITTDSCLKFEATYAFIHSLTECGDTVDICTWTTARLPMIHRTTPWRIPQEWLFCPAFKVCPRQSTK